MTVERNTRVRSSQIVSTLPSDIEAINSPTDLYFIRKASSQDKWEWVAGGGGASNLADLDDVSFATGTPSDNQVLIYDNGTSKWKAEIQQASQVEIAQVDTPTYTTLQDLLNTIRSAGIISGGGFTDNGDGSIAVASGTGLIKISNNATASLKSFNWSANANISLVEDVTNYIMIDYNGGSPQIISSDTDTSNGRTIFRLGIVFREGTRAHLFQNGINLEEWERQDETFHKEVDGIMLASGGALGESGTRNITVTSAVIYSSHRRFPTDAFDSSQTADEFENYYYDGDATGGGVWIESLTESQIDNTYYNNISIGLVELTAQRYGVHWIYLCNDGHVMVVYGQGNYILSNAQASVPPTNLPEHVSNFSTLIGRIIIKKGDSSFTEVSSVGEVIFGSTTITNHNDLSSLQGGTANEYYHLTSADYTELTQWLDNVTLGSDGKLTLPSGVAINEFSSDTTLGDNSDLAVPTEKAVKTYVDGQDHYNSSDFDTDFDGKDLDDLSDGTTYKRLKVDDFTIKENSNIIKIADRIELNTMVIAFRMSVAEGFTKWDMVDGFIDEYEDESFVDTDASSGQSYNSGGDYYCPNPAGVLEIDYCEYATDETAQANWETSSSGGLDSSVKLLLHCNGIDESTDFPDSSDSNHTVTAVNTAKVDTTIKRFGTGSLELDGNSDYLTIPDSPDWDIGTGAFTIDFWINFNSISLGQDFIAINTIGFLIRWGAMGGSNLGVLFNNVWIINEAWSPSTSTWYHIAVTRSASDVRLFVDGTQLGSTGSSSFNIASSQALTIGRFGTNPAEYVNGYMDEIRIVKGEAIWTSNFTPPTGEYGVGFLQSYSEDTIKTQGSYSLKVVADITDSLNENVRNTFGTGNNKDLSPYEYIKFDVYASRVGTNLQMRIHDTGGTIKTKDIVIETGEEDSWKTITWDISSETGVTIDDIDYIELKIINADAENTIYLDNIYAGTSPDNMILISEADSAEADPSNARIVLFEQDVDSITVGTDIKAYISKDDGVSWQQVTLEDEGDYNANIRILSGVADLTATGIGSATGYPIRYKVTTHNEKDLRIHGTGVNYD